MQYLLLLAYLILNGRPSFREKLARNAEHKRAVSWERDVCCGCVLLCTSGRTCFAVCGVCGCP